MQPKLGILAGGGALPAMLVQECRRQGRPYFVIAFEGQADPALVSGEEVVPHAWVRLGAAGTALKHLRKQGVGELVMAGSIHRPTMAALRPDFWAVKVLARAGGLTRGDDAVLSTIIEALRREGFGVVGVDDVMPDLVASEGVLGTVQPDAAALADIEAGVAAALDLGARDIGQGAVIRGGQVVALETAAGTDAMLRECAAQAPAEPAGVLVKVSKPGQERRADLPTIGTDTVTGARMAGLRGIAVEAGGALIVERDAGVAAADAAGLFVTGVRVDHGA